jgi:hypothetical protein
MWRAFLVSCLLALSFSPLDAREPEPVKKPPARERGDLRRDIERISKEIYAPAPPPRAPKKR